MNLSTSTKMPTLRNRTIKALLLGVIALAASGLATAHDATPQPTSNTYQAALQATIVPTQAGAEAGSRIDWNVDYPSQLAPQTVRVAHNVPTSKLTSTVDKDANEQF
ncbi:MAG: hypothetical protein JO278_15505 [Dyella sp.]|nr:hypothetical protein [Dyella sp.]